MIKLLRLKHGLTDPKKEIPKELKKIKSVVSKETRSQSVLVKKKKARTRNPLLPETAYESMNEDMDE